MLAPREEFKTVLDRLGSMAVGDTITYQEIGRLIGSQFNPRYGPGYQIVKHARDALLRDRGYVFAPIRGEGLKRLTPTDTVSYAARHSKRIRRISKRGLAEVVSVGADFDTLSQEQRVQHNLMGALYGVTAHLHTAKSKKKIEASIDRASVGTRGAGPLELGQTLALFGKSEE